MQINDHNCPHCKGTGIVYGHGAFGESESYNCGCGFLIESVEDAKALRKRLKRYIKENKNESE